MRSLILENIFCCKWLILHRTINEFRITICFSSLLPVCYLAKVACFETQILIHQRIISYLYNLQHKQNDFMT